MSVTVVLGEPKCTNFALKFTNISIYNLHLLSMWPDSECSIGVLVESSTLLLGSLVDSETEGDAAA